MSCFKIPGSICDDLASMIRSFWWGQTMGWTRLLGWVRRNVSANGGKRGGGVVWDLKAFNIALLAKQGWWLQTCPNSLFHHAFKAKYFPNHDFIIASLGGAPPFAWRSIMSSQQVVKAGCRWLIGNGESANDWGDKRLPTPTSFQVSMERVLVIGADWSSEWGMELSVGSAGFLWEWSRFHLAIPFNSSLPPDTRIWAFTSSGHFSVASAYWVALTAKVEAQNNGSNGENCEN